MPPTSSSALSPRSVESETPPPWSVRNTRFDIHVLVRHWAILDARCDVLWFEYDTPRTLGDPEDDGRLVEHLASSGRTLLVYDNLGRRMVQLPPGDSAGLRTLSGWLHQQVDGHVVVPYLDVWALSERAARLLDVHV